MSYQGLLRTAIGNVVPDGNYTLTFRLYNVAAGGAALWTEAQTLAGRRRRVQRLARVGHAVRRDAVRGPVLARHLGRRQPELTPRVRLASSPYAFTARHVEPNVVSSVDGVTNDEGNIDLVAGANVTITPNDAANTITISAAGGGGGIGGSGTAPLCAGLHGRRRPSVIPTCSRMRTGWSYRAARSQAPSSRDDKGDESGACCGLPTRLRRDAGRRLEPSSARSTKHRRRHRRRGRCLRLSAVLPTTAPDSGPTRPTWVCWATTSGAIPITFGVAGYTFGDYDQHRRRPRRQSYRARSGAPWATRDASSNWWGVYTENNAQVGGLTMPTGAADGRVLTSDAFGNAAWQTPQAEIMTYHNEGATTTILATPTQYDDGPGHPGRAGPGVHHRDLERLVQDQPLPRAPRTPSTSTTTTTADDHRHRAHDDGGGGPRRRYRPRARSR